jgi:hypothetical protein
VGGSTGRQVRNDRAYEGAPTCFCVTHRFARARSHLPSRGRDERRRREKVIREGKAALVWQSSVSKGLKRSPPPAPTPFRDPPARVIRADAGNQPSAGPPSPRPFSFRFLMRYRCSPSPAPSPAADAADRLKIGPVKRRLGLSVH